MDEQNMPFSASIRYQTGVTCAVVNIGTPEKFVRPSCRTGGGIDWIRKMLQRS